MSAVVHHHHVSLGEISCSVVAGPSTSWWHLTTCKRCLRRRPDPDTELCVAAALFRAVPEADRRSLFDEIDRGFKLLEVAYRMRGEEVPGTLIDADRALVALIMAALREH